ncbi:MAG: AAA family ATPase [Planctomycetia bacterium]
MFIERIDVERFGALRDVTIDGLGPGVQVLHGTNETGKTSLLEFVRAVFFGFEGLFRRGVLDPQRPCAGRLVVVSGPEARRISIERRHEGPQIASLTKASYEDGIIGLGGDTGDLVDIVDLATRPEQGGRPYLQDLVGEIDETSFTNVMAFGLDELHELRTLDPEGCGSRLYELAAGLDRSKVSRVLTHLRNALSRLDSDDPATSPIESLRRRRRDVLERLAGLRSPAIAAGGLAAEKTRIDAEIASLEAAVERSEAAEEVIRRVLPLEPLHAEMHAAAARVAALEGTALVHPDLDGWKRAVKRRDRLAREATRRKKIRARRARLLAAVAAESAVWKKRSAVAALVEEETRIERLAADVARAESHAKLAARRFGEQIGMAGLSRMIAVDAAGEASTDLVLPEGFALSFAPLRARARAWSRASREVRAAKRRAIEASSELKNTRGAVTGAGTRLGGMTIAEAIEEASGRATTIRNRIGTGARIAELDASLAAMERDVAQSVEGQLLPLGWLIALGAVFVVGAGMLLSGLLLPASVTGSLAYAVAALGLAGTGLASVTTWSLDRAASTRLEAARQQYDMVRSQREEAVAQLAQLDARIPADATHSLERRLAAAEAEVERLEALAGREGSVHLLSDRLTVAKQELKRAIASRKSAKLRWQRSLEHRGLPATLSPRDVRMIEMHRQSLLSLDDDRRRLSEEARQKREELAAWAHRIDQTMVECDLVPEGTPIDHLRQLRERLETDGRAIRQRSEAARRLERARSRHRGAIKAVKHADRGIAAFYGRWDVATEQEFLAKVDRRPLFRKARSEAEAAQAAWVEARRTVTEPADLEHWLAETSLTLEKRLADARDATDRLRESLIAVEDRRGLVAKRLDAAARDRSTEPLQAELASIEHELALQLDRRRLLERAGLLLEETRAAVARDHQPPALRDASHWLARLTDGRYTRITTTIDEARLEVHERDGTVWLPERLSRGTREQVFLALRLALVRDLQRHGVMLPLVMDDALVNFDDDRARAAARVLMEFVADQPRERQMLALTCHAHVAAIFASAGATVRSMSGSRITDIAAPAMAAAPERPVVHPAIRTDPPASRTDPPRHVAIAAETSGDPWPAERFFFGGPTSSSDAPAKTLRRAPRRRKK